VKYRSCPESLRGLRPVQRRVGDQVIVEQNIGQQWALNQMISNGEDAPKLDRHRLTPLTSYQGTAFAAPTLGWRRGSAFLTATQHLSARIAFVIRCSVRDRETPIVVVAEARIPA